MTTNVIYLRACAEGADWADVAQTVLLIDPSDKPERVRRAWESHMARADRARVPGFA